MACSVTLERLQCPITRDLMEDPVIAEDGYTYERSAITRWINDNGTSPLTRIPLRVSELRPNRAVEELIDAYREQSRNPQTTVNIMFITLAKFDSYNNILDIRGATFHSKKCRCTARKSSSHTINFK